MRGRGSERDIQGRSPGCGKRRRYLSLYDFRKAEPLGLRHQTSQAPNDHRRCLGYRNISSCPYWSLNCSFTWNKSPNYWVNIYSRVVSSVLPKHHHSPNRLSFLWKLGIRWTLVFRHNCFLQKLLLTAVRYCYCKDEVLQEVTIYVCQKESLISLLTVENADLVEKRY